MTPDDLSARRSAAEAVARDAGRLASSYLAGPSTLAFALKGPQDVVTVADAAVEALIVRSLRSSFPARFHWRRGRRSGRRHVVGNRSDRRHGEFRARTAALVRVHRVRGVGAHRDRGDLRPERRSVVFDADGGRAHGATARPSA